MAQVGPYPNLNMDEKGPVPAYPTAPPVVVDQPVYTQQPLQVQPGVMTQGVVVQQGTMAQGMYQQQGFVQADVIQVQVNSPKNNWSQGICGCFNDMEMCCCASFCWPCLGCNIAWSLNESCWVPNCMIGGMLALRTKTRMTYGIRGTICEDCVTICICPCCSFCQLGAELKAHDDYQSC